MNTNWKKVEGYDQYEVNPQGEVRSVIRYRSGWVVRLKKPQKGRGGYPAYLLYSHNKPKGHYAHRLVATAFIPNPSGYLYVNHKDGVKTNCSVENLEWCSFKENMIHAFNSGLVFRKLTLDQVREIRQRSDSGESRASLSKIYPCNPSMIRKIATRKSWVLV